MENLLSDIQCDVPEIEKVSLERLAEKNPDLLLNIKKAAEDSLRAGGARMDSTDTNGRNTRLDNGMLTSALDKDLDGSAMSLPIGFLIETRTIETISRSKGWLDLQWEPTQQVESLIEKMQQEVHVRTTDGMLYPADDSIQLTGSLATISALTNILSLALQNMQQLEGKKQKRNEDKLVAGFTGRSGVGARLAVDRKLFTNDGIKERNHTVIGLLYEAGLPFLSSTDGRRFRTQIELANHLDSLFKKHQFEKTIARIDERGWYVDQNIWTGEKLIEDMHASVSKMTAATAFASDMTQRYNDNFSDDPSENVVPVNEEQDHCVICGRKFSIQYDSRSGSYMYENCREIEVLQSDVSAETAIVFVHVTCWRGLGSPDALIDDQIV
jgi:pre-mRNA cleavage complex 2 protein Pcf11